MNVGLQWIPANGGIEPTLPEGRTGAVRVAVGSVGQSPGSPQVGMIRYETDRNHFVGYVGPPGEAGWRQILSDYDIGRIVQAYSPQLDRLSAYPLPENNDILIYYGSGFTVMSTGETGRQLLQSVSADYARIHLELGTLATQNANSVAISGGSITGITDLAVADGGTGASTAAQARANLGLAIGVDVQAYDAELAALAGLTSAANKLPYFTGAGSAATTDLTAFGRSLIDDADAAAARSTLGLGALATKSNFPSETHATVAPLSSAYAITGDSEWQDTGAIVTLPNAGKYLIMANVRVNLHMSVATGICNIQLRLRDRTAGALVPNSFTLGVSVSDTGRSDVTSPISVVYTTTADNTQIEIQALRAATTGSTFNISAVSHNLTRITYMRLD